MNAVHILMLVDLPYKYGDKGHSSGLVFISSSDVRVLKHILIVRYNLFGDVGSNAWPVGTGHPCFGCTEKGIGFEKPLHQTVDSVIPPVDISKGGVRGRPG